MDCIYGNDLGHPEYGRKESGQRDRMNLYDKKLIMKSLTESQKTNENDGNLQVKKRRKETVPKLKPLESIDVSTIICYCTIFLAQNNKSCMARLFFPLRQVYN